MNLSRYIDHTILNATATRDDIIKHCEEGCEHGFHSVCLNPYWVKLATEVCNGSPIKVCAVIGFPLGATTPFVKLSEAASAVAHGAEELDMVMNLGAALSGDWESVEDDIEAVVRVSEGRTVKVILECGSLTEHQIRVACRVAESAGAQFVKTSTGFGSSGATVEAVTILKDAVEGRLGIKASGGIKTAADATQMLEAGATRIGTSSGLSIVGEALSTT